MPGFRYRARDREGKIVQGTLESVSESSVADRLMDMGYYPVEITGVHRAPLFVRFHRRRRIPVSEMVVFHRQLATMYAAGLPIIYSLSTLADSTTHRRFRNVISAIRTDVEGGDTLSGTLENFPDIFDEVTVNMIRIGEASGNLAEILERLAEYEEKSSELRSRIKNAMLYPIILGVVAMAVVTFALVGVIPRFAAIFSRMDVPLPLPTRALMAVSRIVTTQGWFVLLGAAVLVGLLMLAVRTKQGRWMWDGLLFRLPVMGEMRLKNLTARFARNLATMLQSGVEILYSFEVSERTLNSVRLARALNATRNSIREGESIAPVLEDQGVFPQLVTRMIGVGEETGRLGDMLFRVAGYYELELEVMVKRLTALLEPMLVVMMAGIVAFVGAATLLPLFNLIKYMK